MPISNDPNSPPRNLSNPPKDTPKTSKFAALLDLARAKQAEALQISAELASREKKIAEQNARRELFTHPRSSDIASLGIQPIRTGYRPDPGYISDKEALYIVSHLRKPDPRFVKDHKYIRALASDHIIQLFWKRVKIPQGVAAERQQFECWIWTGARNNGGKSPYFSFRDPETKETYGGSALGFAFALRTGEVFKEAGFQLRCGNSDCINPSHMGAWARLPMPKIKRGRKPEGWVRPTYELVVPYDQSTADGRERTKLWREMLRMDGTTPERAKQVVDQQMLGTLQPLKPPSPTTPIKLR